MTLDPKAKNGAGRNPRYSRNGGGNSDLETTSTPLSSAKRNELYDLIDLLLDEQLDGEGQERLDQLLAGSGEAQGLYIAEMNRHASLVWQWSVLGGRDEWQGSGDEGRGIRDSENANPQSPIPNQQISFIEPPTPPIVLDLSLTSHYPLATSHYFVGGPVFSYLVATIILGMMLLGAWAYKITHYQQDIVKRSQPSTPSSDRPELVFVGQITGMKDCRWADPQTETFIGSSVPLGRKYALASGLMEITYNTEAKVILEGPCTYEVESRAGGYLALGKLTAKVEGSGVRGQGPEKTNLQISKSPNPQIPSSFILHPSSFVVKTPTAIVTDLGTEFGVEVSAEGNTASHVFRGSVRVRVVGEGLKDDVVLRENESARVVKGKKGRPRLVKPDEAGNPPKFVRRLVESPKLLDLLDIVAGGNGTGRRRERGIDPTTGWEDPAFVAQTRRGDGIYRPVTWHRLIDGVVVPERHTDRMQLDSAGHFFEGMHKNAGIAGFTYGSIWARAADVAQPKLADDVSCWVYSADFDGRLSPDRRGMLCLHANAGITFDLAAMRKMYAETRPARLRAVVGLADVRRLLPSARVAADVWVFVDGQMKFQRPDLRWKDGAIDVDVPIGEADRFLTLVSTDSGSGHAYDCVVFGDPVLDMTPTVSENHRENLPMEP